MAALRPHLSLQSDRCYNAPDTEFDYTEQGGLMWGDQALGKLVAGPDPLKPQVEVFVDDEAGTDVAEKVRRRLQHFIDRKIASLFEPLLALQKDESLTGLARGFAFRLVEALGILPRDGVAAEVKALDQDARGALRKHGLRFGQYTIFLPALLKPAPTRLRLVLWSLARGLAEFPESPPPGLVTIPNIEGTPEGSYTMSGYHRAGTRAIRIDMLERLADQLRLEDSRAGFEAKPDMLSITGMTLDQFADLMAGLGYAGEKAERIKVKPAVKPRELTAEEVLAEAAKQAEAARLDAEDAANADIATPVDVAEDAPSVPDAQATDQPGAAPAADPPDADPPDADPPDAAAVDQPAAAAPETDPADAAPVDPADMETFYTFTWRPKPRERAPRPDRRDNDRPGGGRRPADRPQGEAPRGGKADGRKPDGGKRFGGNKGQPPHRDEPPKTHEARPPRKEKPLDPDSPFAILATLKDKR